MIDAETAAKYVALAAAIGAVIPFLQSLIQAPWWSPKVKAALSLGLSIVAAIIAYIVNNGFNFSDPVELAIWLVGIFSSVVVTYHGLWRPTDLAPKLERATSKDDAAAEPATLVPDGAIVDSGGHPTGEVDNSELLETDGTENIPPH